MLCCMEGREIKYLETFRDIGAVLCGGGVKPNQYDLLYLRRASQWLASPPADRLA